MPTDEVSTHCLCFSSSRGLLVKKQVRKEQKSVFCAYSPTVTNNSDHLEKTQRTLTTSLLILRLLRLDVLLAEIMLVYCEIKWMSQNPTEMMMASL